MSKKRTSPESNKDEQTNEDSDSVFQQDDNAKRAKLISLSDTTLQDLPMELIECILVKAVAMEVEDMKLAKSVWKEKADPVISRLGTVCSQWSSILTTNFFRNELNRTLDRTAQKTTRLEILHQSALNIHIQHITTLKDEIFILRGMGYLDLAINVYHRNDPTALRDVIPLLNIYPCSLEASNMTNCLYMLASEKPDSISIVRVMKDDEHQFNITKLITDVYMPNPRPTLSVAANGSLILVRHQQGKLPVISIYNADGSIQHQLRTHRGIPKFSDIIPKSNGNLVLVSTNDQMQTTLTEIDMDVTIIRRYKSHLNSYYRCINHADNYGRMLLVDGLDRTELLDSEFNLLEFSGPQLDARRFIYNRERNEIVTVVSDPTSRLGLLTIFRFTEE